MPNRKSTGHPPGHNAAKKPGEVGFQPSIPCKPMPPTPAPEIASSQKALNISTSDKQDDSNDILRQYQKTIPRPVSLTAPELMEYLSFNPFDLKMRAKDEYETLEEMMERKADEADESGLSDNLIDNGILEPIEVLHSRRKGKPFLVDGHHRIASRLRHAPSTPIPITHQEADPVV